jgi:hypothetical protein
LQQTGELWKLAALASNYLRPLLNVGVMRIEAGMDARGGATGALYMISIYFRGD